VYLCKTSLYVQPYTLFIIDVARSCIHRSTAVIDSFDFAGIMSLGRASLVGSVWPIERLQTELDLSLMQYEMAYVCRGHLITDPLPDNCDWSALYPSNVAKMPELLRTAPFGGCLYFASGPFQGAAYKYCLDAGGYGSVMQIEDGIWVMLLRHVTRVCADVMIRIIPRGLKLLMCQPSYVEIGVGYLYMSEYTHL
jgi:hypothetical protein